MKAGDKYIPQVYTNKLNNKGNKVRKNLPKVNTKEDEQRAREVYYKTHVRKIDFKTRFRDYCQYWLDGHIFKAESTEEMYRIIIRKHLIPFFGNMRMTSIKKSEIDYFIKNMINNRYSKHYINLTVNIIRKLFNDACKNGFVQYSPTKAIESFEYKKQEVIIPNKEQSILITEIIKKADKYRFPLLFGWCAGLRRGEALGVQWGDIDFKNNIINVNRQIVTDYKHPKPPKRGEKRKVVLIQTLRVELLKVPQEEREPGRYIYRNVRSEKPKSLDYYFKKHISSQVKNILGLDKNQKFVFHYFRHINLSKLLLSPDVPINAIREYAGHKSIDITTQIYGHRAPEEMNVIREALSKTLS